MHCNVALDVIGPLAQQLHNSSVIITCARKVLDPVQLLKTTPMAFVLLYFS